MIYILTDRKAEAERVIKIWKIYSGFCKIVRVNDNQSFRGIRFKEDDLVVLCDTIQAIKQKDIILGKLSAAEYIKRFIRPFYQDYVLLSSNGEVAVVPLTEGKEVDDVENKRSKSRKRNIDL